MLLPKALPPEEPPNRPPPAVLAAPNAGAGDDPKAGYEGHLVSQGCLLWVDEGLARKNNVQFSKYKGSQATRDKLQGPKRGGGR